MAIYTRIKTEEKSKIFLYFYLFSFNVHRKTFEQNSKVHYQHNKWNRKTETSAFMSFIYNSNTKQIIAYFEIRYLI